MQQHEDQGSSAVESTSASNIKRYRVSESWSDTQAILDVDHSVLTPELANEINQFWSGHEERLSEAYGEPVRAVVCFAGYVVVRLVLMDGGESFAENHPHRTDIWTRKFHAEEGWGEGCGIRVVAVTAEIPDSSEFEVVEVGNV